MSTLDRELAEAMFALNRARSHTIDTATQEVITHIRDQVVDLRIFLDPTLAKEL